MAGTTTLNPNDLISELQSIHHRLDNLTSTDPQFTALQTQKRDIEQKLQDYRAAKVEEWETALHKAIH